MKETAVNKLSYPEDGDPTNGPEQIKDLANDLDVVKWGSQNLKPTTGVLRSSADLVLGAGYADVPGLVLEITPAVESKLLVEVVFLMAVNGESPFGQGTIKVDAKAEEAALAYLSSVLGAPTWQTVAQSYEVALKGGEKHTIKARAAGKASTAVGFHTSMAYELYAS